MADKVRRDDIAPNRRRGGDIRVVLSPKTTGCAAGFFGTLRLEPAEYVAEHYHPYSEEFLYVLTGRVSVRLDGETLPLGTGEGTVVPKSARHRVTNDGEEPAELAFCLAPLAPRPDLGHVDTEPLPAPAEPVPDVGGAS
jgi:putative monooxygenase